MKILGAMLTLLSLLCISIPAKAVIIDNHDWAKPGDFTNVTYNDLITIFDVTTGELLNNSNSKIGALDFIGYTWASLEEVASMFSSHPDLDISPLSNITADYDSAWATYFVNMLATNDILNGLTRTLYDETPDDVIDHVIVALIQDAVSVEFLDRASTDTLIPINSTDDRFGVWLYKTSPVPEPATFLLFGIGLLGLTGLNRIKK